MGAMGAMDTYEMNNKNESKKNLKTYKLLISGRVQGVGFRYFAEDKARILQINGYVRNTIDNKVEILCQGYEPNIDIFIKQMQRGPTFANVKDIKITEIKDAQIYNYFEIKF